MAVVRVEDITQFQMLPPSPRAGHTLLSRSQQNISLYIWRPKGLVGNLTDRDSTPSPFSRMWSQKRERHVFLASNNQQT